MATTTLDEVWALFREVAQAQKETERLMKEQARESDWRMKRLDEQLGHLGNRLGEFVEEMVKPAVVWLFRERGIEVHEVYRDVEVERGPEEIELDLLVVDDDEAVLVEVKSKLAQADVDEHMERLGKFKRLVRHFGGVRVMGAVAAMVVPKEVARYAYRQGLFVLAQSGESMVILNDGKFQARTW